MGKERLLTLLQLDTGLYLKLRLLPSGSVSISIRYEWYLPRYRHRSYSRTMWRLECWKT